MTSPCPEPRRTRGRCLGPELRSSQGEQLQGYVAFAGSGCRGGSTGGRPGGTRGGRRHIAAWAAPWNRGKESRGKGDGECAAERSGGKRDPPALTPCGQARPEPPASSESPFGIGSTEPPCPKPPGLPEDARAAPDRSRTHRALPAPQPGTPGTAAQPGHPIHTMPSHVPHPTPRPGTADPPRSCLQLPRAPRPPRTRPAARAVPGLRAPFPCPAPACPSSRPRPPLRGAPLPALPTAPRLGTATLRRLEEQRTPGKEPRGAAPGAARALPPVLTVCPAGSAASAPAARPRRHHGMRALRLRRRWPGAGGRARQAQPVWIRGSRTPAAAKAARGGGPGGTRWWHLSGGDMSGHCLSLTDAASHPRALSVPLRHCVVSPGHCLSLTDTALSPPGSVTLSHRLSPHSHPNSPSVSPNRVPTPRGSPISIPAVDHCGVSHFAIPPHNFWGHGW